MQSDLRQIRYFVATAEELHFRRAAERLGIAQPALSRTIRNLETELGVTLFTRTNRSVHITTAGAVFLDGCRSILGQVDRTIEQTRRADEGRVGALRIGYTDSAIAGALPNLLKAFQVRQPQITLKPQHGVTVTQLRKLADGELDVGFVTGPINLPGYEQRMMQSESFVCVCADTHRLAGRLSIPLGELADEDFVHGTSQDWNHFYDYFIPLCRRAGFVPRIVQEAFNTAGILGLVSCGMGVTVLTEQVCSSLDTGLVAIPISNIPERLLTMSVWRTDHLTKTAQHFVEFLTETAPKVVSRQLVI